MARQKLSLKDIKNAPELKRALESVGLFTRVAQKVGVTPGHALQVARGKRQSHRVLEAIILEVRRIDRDAERAA